MSKEEKSTDGYTDKDLVWASGHYLTKHFPHDWHTWEDDKVDTFIEEHSWQPFEYYSARDVMELITNLAFSVRHYMNTGEPV